MNGTQSRRAVLQAVAGTGVGVALAGCTSSVPGIGGDSDPSNPCSDVDTYFEAILNGDAETAVEYEPYEYDSNTSREEALERVKLDEELRASLDEMNMSIDCEENRTLDDGEIDDISADFGDHEITAARELTLTTTATNGEQEQENENTGIVVKIDGDGWFFLEQ